MSAEEKQDERLQNYNAKSVTQVTDRGEETIIDTNSNKLKSPLPSNSKSFNEGGNNLLQEYLSRLRDCPNYPFDEEMDTSFFHYIRGEYPGINILEQLDKKIAWWREHPSALKLGASSRNQLAEWFQKEHEFQNRRD